MATTPPFTAMVDPESSIRRTVRVDVDGWTWWCSDLFGTAVGLPRNGRWGGARAVHMECLGKDFFGIQPIVMVGEKNTWPALVAARSLAGLHMSTTYKPEKTPYRSPEIQMFASR